MTQQKIVGFLSSFLFIAALSRAPLHAQTVLWSDVHESEINVPQADRQIIPRQYRTLQLDFAKLKILLASAPDEADIVAGGSGLIVAFPMPDGGMARFRVWEAPVMHPDLSAQFPDIQSFAGKGIDFPTAVVRFDVSPNGFHGMMLRTGRGSVFIDPYAKGNTEFYISYFKKDFEKQAGETFACHVERSPNDLLDWNSDVKERAGDCGNLRTYRLALACTGEYANFHGAFGANKAPALAAMNTSMNRVNGVFETDCSIRMIIIANNTNIIYTDGATDPYSNGNGSAMLGQNQTTCDGVIGTANYDIGHVFSTGGGGIAVLNSPCNAATKAQGVTGGSSPVGDPFDIDYVAHEMGHQYGAQHTQYNNCNRSNSSAMEPGSASTIMGYAGICDPDVQSNSDDYFHARSLQQIGAFVTAGGGNNCDLPVANGNAAPTVNSLTNVTIPISTPFILTATASDPNGHPLTYCWEQMNAYTNPAQPMPPVSTNTTGPMFRSLDPIGSPSRYFPNFPDVLANINPVWEELPSISRSMLFRVTARDDRPDGGCTGEKEITVTTNAGFGPFVVTSPNTNVTYGINSVQTVTWNVANTTAAPVSCPNVNILISTDGGANFSTLASNTPNDGSQSVTMPNVVSNLCRIMIECGNNIFYDVSDVNFQLIFSLPVELVDFNAYLENKSVLLKWSTASEKANKGFRVERGKGSDFQEIGWVNGVGEATHLQRYSFTDENPPSEGWLYYRLAQIDLDGAVAYSDMRAVRAGAVAQMSVYPNPAGAAIQLVVPKPVNDESARVHIWNAEGRLVREQDFQTGVPVEIQSLPKGVYRLELTAENDVFEAVFLKN